MRTFFCFEEMRMTWKAHSFSALKRVWASFTILKTLTLKNEKRAAHDLKRAFCTIFMKSALFFRFEENLRPVSRFSELWRSKIRFGQNVLRMTWKVGFCTIFLQSALFFRFEENLRPVSRFSKLWFGQKVLRMTWKERFVQFALKAHCFLVLERIPGPRDDFENFHAQKYDLAKTCCAWPEKNVLYNFLMESALFSSFGENLRPVSRFWELWRSKIRFGENVLRMTWKAGFVQFSSEAHRFSLLKRISGQFHDFENFDAQKCYFAKTCCAWPVKSVQYNFHERRTVFSFSREFQTRVTILRTLKLQNAIWPKRAAHDLKRAFWTIFMKNALFSRFEKNFRPVWRF